MNILQSKVPDRTSKLTGLDIKEFPECYNCEKSISMFGKYIRINGTIRYVHQSYNEETKECNNDKGIMNTDIWRKK